MKWATLKHGLHEHKLEATLLIKTSKLELLS